VLLVSGAAANAGLAGELELDSYVVRRLTTTAWPL